MSQTYITLTEHSDQITYESHTIRQQFKDCEFQENIHYIGQFLSPLDFVILAITTNTNLARCTVIFKIIKHCFTTFRTCSSALNI